MSTASFKQADWGEPLVFELGKAGRMGFMVPKIESEVERSIGDVTRFIPKSMVRKKPLRLPELSELEVVRHFIHLSQMNYGVNSGRLYPLGSCTMKYNPIINERIAANPKLTSVHPYQDVETVQGVLEIMYKLKEWLAEITGTDEVSLQPAAGAHGELLGVLIIRARHGINGELEKRTEIVVPDSAHGTNLASAAMGGFKVVVIPSGDDGCVNIEALKEAVSYRTAGLMLTNPNTLGIFERDIEEISKIIHEVGGLLYYDGANLNAILGKSRPGDMGFDIVHINVHKTFSTPHGGGGPGSGPVGVKGELSKFLPVPTVEFNGEKYYLDYDRPHSIGKIGGFYGNISPLVKAFAYLLSMGSEGLEEAAELSVLNSNYIAKKLLKIRGYELPYKPEKPRKHECVFSAKPMHEESGVRAVNIAKKMLDYGLHAPTIYFPPIVDEALMIEPTETEPVEELDRFIEVLKKISNLAYTRPREVLEAPRNTTVTRLDEVKANHPSTFSLSWRMYKKRRLEKGH